MPQEYGIDIGWFDPCFLNSFPNDLDDHLFRFWSKRPNLVWPLPTIDMPVISSSYRRSMAYRFNPRYW